MRHFARAWHLKFVFENSSFQIAEAFQFLLCDGRCAAVVNKSRTCWARLWYRLHFVEINRKSATGNSVIFMLLHWYCHRCLGCGKMIKFTLKIVNIFGDVFTRDGTISLCQHDASAQIVVSHNFSTHVSDPFRSSPHWLPNYMIVTHIYQYIICPISWAIVALDTAVRLWVRHRPTGHLRNLIVGRTFWCQYL